MRTLVIIFALATAGPSLAIEQETLNKVGWRLGVSYQCAHVTGDWHLYDDAKEYAWETLPIPMATEMIIAVETEMPLATDLTELLCRDLGY